MFPPLMAMVLVDGVVSLGTDGSDGAGAVLAAALSGLVTCAGAFGDVTCGEGDGAVWAAAAMVVAVVWGFIVTGGPPIPYAP